jgi:hypothetical protein
MGVNLARVLAGTLGVLLMLAGIGVASIVGPAGGLLASLFLFLPGAALLVGVAIEQTRYRSLAADREREGPGGGEPDRPEARFRPTEERFVDPTTGIRMRVYQDPRTGERRYVPEA